MATPEDVKKLAAFARITVLEEQLAALARITVPEDQLEKFASEFDSILHYVSQLDSLEVGKRVGNPTPLLPYVNVMREDGTPHEKGIYTEKIAEQFPQREGDSLSVKQILNYD